MIDAPVGILTPVHLEVVQYLPEAELAVAVEACRRDCWDESYLAALKRKKDVVVHAAIFADTPQYAGGEMNLGIMERVLKYRAQKCLAHYLHSDSELTPALFFANYNPVIHGKDLYDVMARMGAGFHPSIGLNRHAPIIIGRMPVEVVREKAVPLGPYAQHVPHRQELLKIYLQDPEPGMSHLLVDMLGEDSGGHISEALRDDDVCVAVVNNILGYGQQLLDRCPLYRVAYLDAGVISGLERARHRV